MAYESVQLSALAYANGFTHWHYRTQDDWNVVLNVGGYFDPAESMLRPGDLLTMTTNLGGVERHIQAFVTINYDGHVVVREIGSAS